MAHKRWMPTLDMPPAKAAATIASIRFAPRLAWQAILPGATFRDRAISCTGAFAGIGLVAAVCSIIGVPLALGTLLVAPIGASAVLLFALPASPLSQPWPVIGGNFVAACVGLIVASTVANFWLAAGLSVGLAILAMSLLRCLHPPGGGTALLGVLGGEAVASAGLTFALWPVTLNATLLVAAAWAFHRLSGHSYPHRPGAAVDASNLPVSRFRSEHIDSALLELGDTLDVSREDLDILFRVAERHAAHGLGKT